MHAKFLCSKDMPLITVCLVVVDRISVLCRTDQVIILEWNASKCSWRITYEFFINKCERSADRLIHRCIYRGSSSQDCAFTPATASSGGLPFSDNNLSFTCECHLWFSLSCHIWILLIANTTSDFLYRTTSQFCSAGEVRSSVLWL